MSFAERNAKQIKIALWIAKRRGIELLDALQMIAVPFAAKYPNKTVNA